MSLMPECKIILTFVFFKNESRSWIDIAQFFSYLNFIYAYAQNIFDIFLTMGCYCFLFVICAHVYNMFDNLFVKIHFMDINPFHG